MSRVPKSDGIFRGLIFRIFLKSVLHRFSVEVPLLKKVVSKLPPNFRCVVGFIVTALWLRKWECVLL